MPGFRRNPRAPRPTGFAAPSTGQSGTRGPRIGNYKRKGAGGAKTGGIHNRALKPKIKKNRAKKKGPYKGRRVYLRKF